MKRLLTIMVLFLTLGLTASIAENKSDEQLIQEVREKLPKLMSVSNVGREFRFSIPPCYEAGNPNDFIKIYVTSPVRTLVTVEIPGKGYYKTRMTIPNDVIGFDISPTDGQPFRYSFGTHQPIPERVYERHGIHVYAKDPLVVYCVVRFQHTSDGFLVYPTSALGTDYVIASYPDMGNMFSAYFPSQTAITGCFDNTRVRFTLGGAVSAGTAGGMKPGEWKEWTLNKGDVLMIQSMGALSTEPDITGSRVRADKPVSVVSGNHCANIPTTNQWCDYIVEMDIPMHTWGRYYHVPETPNRRFSQIVRIFAKENNTRIYRDGMQVGLIKRGGGGTFGDGFLEMRINNVGGAPRSAVFSGDKPIAVTFYNPGTQEDVTSANSDPFQMAITPIEQYQNEITFCTPNVQGGQGFPDNFFTLVYQTNQFGMMPDDMQFGIVRGGDVTWRQLNAISPHNNKLFPYDVPYNNDTLKFAMATFRLANDGVYKLRDLSGRTFACYSFGYGAWDSYGYPTSTALLDLETPDLYPPIPTYDIDCEGTVTNGFVRDMPDEDDYRSNLADVYFLTEQSFNYRFTCCDPHIEPGFTRDTRWSMKVDDITKDARGLVRFADRAGNDTIIVINYYATNISLTPTSLAFNQLKLGEQNTMEYILKNESTTAPVLIGRIGLAHQDRNFTISHPAISDFPFELAQQEEVKILVTFNAASEGTFWDSIYVADFQVKGDRRECFEIGARMTASVGNPIIEVDDWDFRQVLVGQIVQKELAIRNVGTSSLVIRGYSGPTNSVFTHNLPDPSYLASDPIVIEPNRNFLFTVFFRPGAEIKYNDQIVFESDATTRDNIAVLAGEGIKPSLWAGSWHFERKRIHRNNAPREYEHSIELMNPGTQEVTITRIEIADPTDRSAFIFNEGDFINMKIEAGGKNTYSFKFKPIRIGYHRLEIKYLTNSPGIEATTILEGIGTAPMVRTNDIDFGQMIVGDQPIGGKTIRFTNIDYADEADDLTITAFNNVNISNNWANYSIEGFKFDGTKMMKNGATPTNFPIVLVPGEFVEITGEFNAVKSGVHQGMITSVSDAALLNTTTNLVIDENGNVTSTWTGSGIFQGIGIIGDQTTVCLDVSQILNVVVSNTEEQPIEVTNISLNPPLAQFEILGPATPFTLDPANPNRTIQIRYVSSTVGAFKTDVVVANNSLRNPTISTAIQGTTVGYTQTTRSRTNPEEQIIGGSFEYILTMNLDQDPVLSNVKDLEVRMRYKSEWITADINTLNLGAVFAGRYTILSREKVLHPATDEEEVIIRLRANDRLSGSGAQEMLKMTFRIYLPARVDGDLSKIDRDKVINIKHTVSTDDACVIVNGNQTKITIKNVCIEEMRNVMISRTPFSLAEVSPNPVSSRGAEIKFSVGLETQTDIRIYNSKSELVATPISNVLQVGEYSVRIPIENLPSGVYFYEMTSGPFKEVKKLIIQK